MSPIDLPSITGLVPYQVEQTIERLREALETALDDAKAARTALAAIPRSLTLDEIQAALSATGSHALATAGLLNTVPPATNPVPPPSPTPGPGAGDGGRGNAGCNAAGANGHVAGTDLTPFRAGEIVCGTGNEFPALKAPTATLDDREANAAELVGRMIWHLQQGGFTAGNQNNSSTGVRLSKDKLAVETVTDGVTTMRAYDVFIKFDSFEIEMETNMLEVFPANYYASGGIPD